MKINLRKLAITAIVGLFMFTGCNNDKSASNDSGNKVSTEKSINDLKKIESKDEYIEYLSYIDTLETEAESKSDEEKLKAYSDLLDICMVENENSYNLLLDSFEEEYKESLKTGYAEWKDTLNKAPETVEDYKTLIDEVEKNTLEFVEMYYYSIAE